MGYNAMWAIQAWAVATLTPAGILAMWNGFSGGWYYNSYLNMYSFMPFGGTMYSPFGFGYFNPITVVDVYTPGGYYWNGAERDPAPERPQACRFQPCPASSAPPGGTPTSPRPNASA